MFSDQPVLAERCRKASSFSCPYIERDLVLSEADQVQKLYDAGKLDESTATQTFEMLENKLDEVDGANCPILNTETCPVGIEMSEEDRLVCAYNCQKSAEFECPHLCVSQGV